MYDFIMAYLAVFIVLFFHLSKQKIIGYL